jgi:glycosyltransferase involved in cell wall biosynthesis
VRKVLYVLHSHPAERPGGAGIYAHELFCAVRDAGELEPTLVARVEQPQMVDTAHGGIRFGLAGDDQNQYYFHTSLDEFDRVLGSARDKRLYTEDWREFLRAVEPDIVHFQHTLWLGYDIIRETRSALPRVPIVYTLHEFLSICHHNGQMVRTNTHELCHQASPRRCHQCFPAIPSQTFFLRERFIKSAFALVDMFIAPSEHARRRFIEWGIPPEKIRHEDYGRFPVPAVPDPPDAGRRRRIGFFGQITKFKGVDVLLEAMKILQREGLEVQLVLRGANLEIMDSVFQARIHALLEETGDSVRFPGRYEQSQLPGLLSAVDWVVVPSIWWETGPLVIHEALMHRRPVICSDIGSMPERIRDGVNGLHFGVGDPFSLADTIRRAVSTPGLWDELRAGITDPHPMDQHLATITALYEELVARAGRARLAPLAEP